MKQTNQTGVVFPPGRGRAGEQVKQVKHKCRAQRHSGGAEMTRKLVKRSKFLFLINISILIIVIITYGLGILSVETPPPSEGVV